jgi:bifunctional non-homologous end joining protein LigD
MGAHRPGGSLERLIVPATSAVSHFPKSAPRLAGAPRPEFSRLSLLALEPPKGAHWIREIKFDRYRTMLVIDDGEARAFSRNRLDWSNRHRPIVEAAGRVRCRSAVMDW